MIGLTRIGRLFPSLLSSLRPSFSTKSTLSQSAQRAIWATAVVRKITFANGQGNFKKSSLRQQLLNLQHPAKSFPDQHYQSYLRQLKMSNNKQLIFDAQIRKQILRMFSDGINLSTVVFSQERVAQGKDLIISPSNPQYLKIFIFCPNVLVTKEIFSALFTCTQSSLIYGEFGISKTISLVLFDYLSSIINKYTYQSFTNQALRKEFQFLTQNYLRWKIPKLFYWSLKLDDNEEKLKDIMLLQASELSAEQKKQLSTITSFQQFINEISLKYTRKGIIIYCLIDQINVMASKFRQWNYFYKNYQSKNKYWKQSLQKITKTIEQLKNQNKSQLLKEKIKQKEQLKLANQKEQMLWQQIQKRNISGRKQGQILRQRMKKFQTIGSIHLYNSSINIQTDLFKPQSHVQEPERTMDLQKGHVKLPIIQIPYFKNIGQKWGRNDFIHYFWFQIWKRLKNNSIFAQQSQLDTLKDIFYEEAKNEIWPNYVRFVSISDMLTGDLKQLFGKEININFSKENFRATAKYIIKQLPESSRTDYQLKLKRFLIKGGKQEEKNRLMFLHLLFGLASGYDQNSNQNLSIQIPKQQKGFIEEQLSKHLGQSYTNKQLFSFDFNKLNTTITFLWTPKQFRDIVSPILYDQTLTAWNVDPSLTENLLMTSKAALGIYLEAALIRALKCKDVIFSFTIQAKEFTKKYEFQTKQVSTFQQLNKKNDGSVSIEKHLENFFTLAKENQKQFIFGVPIAVKQDMQKESPTSRAIDFIYFIYVIYDSSNRETPYIIFSFDLTVSPDISPKRGNAKDTYSPVIAKSKQIGSLNYLIQHTIIGWEKQHKYEKIDNLAIGTILIQAVQLTPTSSDETTKTIIEYYNYLKRVYQLKKDIQKRQQEKKMQKNQLNLPNYPIKQKQQKFKANATKQIKKANQLNLNDQTNASSSRSHTRKSNKKIDIRSPLSQIIKKIDK